VGKINNKEGMTMITLSTIFYQYVLAASLRWKAAGSMKAIGVHVRAPAKLIYCVSEFFIPNAMNTETATTTALDKFLSHFQR